MASSTLVPKYFDALSERLQTELWVQEDYALPYPFAGNKWIKLVGEHGAGQKEAAYITNGGLDSNHCRTLAMWAAFYGHRCHLVLHHDGYNPGSGSLALLDRLGATYTVVGANDIGVAVESSRKQFIDSGFKAVIVPGGGHSLAGIRAYAEYATSALRHNEFDAIFVASGTGGTQAGICIAAENLGATSKVVGVSVARDADRGSRIVQEAIRQTSGFDLDVDFRVDYVDGGYGLSGDRTRAAVNMAGSTGLILDPVYTGKAFAGLLGALESGEIGYGSKVLFWHTGGHYLAATM